MKKVRPDTTTAQKESKGEAPATQRKREGKQHLLAALPSLTRGKGRKATALQGGRETAKNKAEQLFLPKKRLQLSHIVTDFSCFLCVFFSFFMIDHFLMKNNTVLRTWN